MVEQDPVAIEATLTEPARGDADGIARLEPALDGRFREALFFPGEGHVEPRRVLPVYERQLFPELLLGEAGPRPDTAGKTLLENDAIRLWTLDDEIVIATLKTKMRAISPDAGEGLAQAVEMAEQNMAAATKTAARPAAAKKAA